MSPRAERLDASADLPPNRYNPPMPLGGGMGEVYRARPSAAGADGGVKVIGAADYDSLRDGPRFQALVGKLP